MKKINLLYSACFFVVTSYCTIPITISPDPSEELYAQEIEKLTKQLEKTVLLPHEKKGLLLKLTNYFRPKTASPVLDNKKTEVLYGSILQSYHKLLKNPKRIKIADEPLAQKFQEQVLGKIILHENKFIIKPSGK